MQKRDTSETLVINRGEWLTGQALAKNSIGSGLYDAQCKLYCCLGLYCRDVLDISNSVLKGQSYPTNLNLRKIDNSWLGAPVPEISPSTDVSHAIATINDSRNYGPEHEEKIAKAFKEYGNVDVTFTGEYEDAIAKVIMANQIQDTENAYDEENE